MLDFNPVVMAEFIGFFQFLPGNHVVVPFYTFVVLAEGTIISHVDLLSEQIECHDVLAWILCLQWKSSTNYERCGR